MVRSEVTSLVRVSGYFHVHVNLVIEDVPVPVIVPTGWTDPSKAVEAAREWLHGAGRDLTNAFAQAGSLK